MQTIDIITTALGDEVTVTVSRSERTVRSVRLSIAEGMDGFGVFITPTQARAIAAALIAEADAAEGK